MRISGFAEDSKTKIEAKKFDRRRIDSRIQKEFRNERLSG